MNRKSSYLRSIVVRCRGFKWKRTVENCSILKLNLTTKSKVHLYITVYILVDSIKFTVGSGDKKKNILEEHFRSLNHYFL